MPSPPVYQPFVRTAQPRRGPQAPPVYRPQPAPAAALASQPPVYQPGAPKALQAQMPPGRLNHTNPQNSGHPHEPLRASGTVPQFVPASNCRPVIQRNKDLFGEAGKNVPDELAVGILAHYLNDDDRRNMELVSSRARVMVEAARNELANRGRFDAERTLRTRGALDVQAGIAAGKLREALLRRYGSAQISIIKRNSKTLIDGDRIVANILSTVQSDSNKVLALQLLVTSTQYWHLIRLVGKPGPVGDSGLPGEPKDRDGLIGALGKLAAANSEGELKGALGEIHDAIFFSRRFGMVTMDQTKTYTTLIPGQYLDTVKSKQMDLVFSGGGSTYYVETKFDVSTAIGKHTEVPSKPDLAIRAQRVRETLSLTPGAPVKVPFPTDHPLSKLPEVSQQLLGYDAVALERERTKGKKIVKIVSVPNSRGWLRFFTETPSAAGLYIQLGWHLRIGTALLSPYLMKEMQKKVFSEAIGNPAPDYRERNNPTNRPKLLAYALRNINLTPEEFLSKM